MESVFKQTRNPDKVLVVDDGSTDDTYQIVYDRWIDEVKGVYWYCPVEASGNNGIGFARRSGVKAVLGYYDPDYIAFISADDAWQPNFLEVMSQAAEENPGKIIYSGFTICDEKMNPKFDIIPPNYNLDPENFRVWCYQLALKDNMNVNFSSVLIPREVFDIVQFDPNLRFGEDLDFLLRSMLHFDYFLVEQALVKIRTHPESMTNKKINEIHQNNQGIIEGFKVEMKKVKG